jgi:endonuclease G
MKRLFVGLVIIALLSSASAEEILRLDYEGFTVWIDCEKRGAVAFRYNAQHDTGNRPQNKSFYLDPNVPARCQQTSTSSYKGYNPTKVHKVS